MGLLVDMTTNEAHLMSEFRRGKTKAFEEIFVKYHGAICYFVHELLQDSDAAKDIASEIFIKVWRLREDFENIRSVKAFLYVSAKNASLNYLRRAKVINDHQKTSMQELAQEQMSNVVLGQIFDAEVLREVHRAIDTLPTQCKRVIKLTLQGMNTDDIAAMMNLSAQTVRNTRIRALEMLKKRLSGYTVATSVLTLLMWSYASCLYS